MTTDQFQPEIWELRREDTEEVSLFLVCGRRWLHGDPVPTGMKGTQVTNEVVHAETEVTGSRWKWIGHPVAIDLGFTPPKLVYGKFPDGDWLTHPISGAGLSVERARRALHHAYRTVQFTHDLGSAKASLKAKPGVAGSKGRSALWKIALHVSGPKWDKDKLNLSERRERLNAMGFDVTTQALRAELKRT